jgi:hypothetical protein
MKLYVLAGLCLMNGLACAADNLSAAQVKSLMVDKTIAGYNLIKDLDYTVYFRPEGQIVFVTGKGKRQGNWRIADDGHFCTAFPQEPELCTVISPVGDGTYKRMKDDGTHTHTLKSFTAGNVNRY